MIVKFDVIGKLFAGACVVVSTVLAYRIVGVCNCMHKRSLLNGFSDGMYLR